MFVWLLIRNIYIGKNWFLMLESTRMLNIPRFFQPYFFIEKLILLKVTEWEQRTSFNFSLVKHCTPGQNHEWVRVKEMGTKVSPQCMHGSCCGCRKGMPWNKSLLNSDEVKPIALSICWGHPSGRQWVIKQITFE